MKAGKLTLYRVLAGCLLAANCQKSLDSDKAESDTISPKYVSTSKASGSILAESTSIDFVFNEALSSSGYQISGDLASQAVFQVTTTNVTNDTARLIPSPNWTAGLGRTLTLTVKDSAGNRSSEQSFQYDVYVFNGKIYVSDQFGQDTNLGTASFPLKTLKAGIDKARLIMKTATVAVAAATGAYSTGTDALALQDGISLQGGYSFDGTTWSGPTQALTRIARTSAAASSLDQPAATITCNNISASTKIAGFTVEAVSHQYASAIFAGDGCAATFAFLTVKGNSPTALGSWQYAFYANGASGFLLEDSTIDPGKGSSSTANTSYLAGVYLKNSSATLRRNTIAAGKNDGAAGTTADGVYLDGGSSLKIRNNLIYGGKSQAFSRAVFCHQCGMEFQNNTVLLGDGGSIRGVNIRNLSAVKLANNIILKTAATVGSSNACIEEIGSGSSPTEMKNNLLHGCATLYIDADTGISHTNICSGTPGNDTCTQTMNTPTGVSNLKADPMLTDYDGTDNDIFTWNDNSCGTDAGSPARNAGLNFSELFQQDLLRSNRPASPTAWTIGAIQ